jgi:hypothetical protein
MRRMEVITPTRQAGRTPIVPVVLSTIVGTLFLVGGVVLAVIAFGTPLLIHALPGARPDPTQMLTGIALWTLALVGPAACVLFGTTRLVRNLGAARGKATRRSVVVRAMGTLPEDVVIASGLVLPDGRPIADLIVGAFGIAVVRELPPVSVTRIRDGHWEARGRRRWIPLENPLERASRDAERVRRWLAHDDADFLVKTYAAVIGPDPTIPRTPSCAVLTPGQLSGWIAGLPPQRSLTPARRDQVLEQIRDAAR